MSKINFDQILLDLVTAEPIRVSETDPSAVTLKIPVITCLLDDIPDDTPNAKYMAYTLAERLKGGGDVEIEAFEIEFVKRRAEKRFAPMILGQVWDMLEGRLDRTPGQAGEAGAPAKAPAETPPSSGGSESFVPIRAGRARG